MMCRAYQVFTILYRYDKQKRLEDAFGELVGYSDKYRGERTAVIVAPSSEMAWSYIESDQRRNNPEFVQVVACDLDAIVEVHTA